MRLTKIAIDNFRCFESFQINFHPELTVLIAPNASGKTTILDAVRVALWPFVKGFDLGSQTGKSASIQIHDVRIRLQTDGNMEPQVPCKIEAYGQWGDNNEVDLQWLQTRERMKPGTNTRPDDNTKKLTKLANNLEKRSREPNSTVILPLVSYLGTSRLWFEGRFTSTAEDVTLNMSDYSRTSGYLNCLSYSSSFKAFTAWYGTIYRSYREEQIRAIENKGSIGEKGERFAVVIEVVKNAVDALIKDATGWHGLEYKASQNQQLVMNHDHLGSMPVEMLSDGIRNTIAMVADLAFRAYKLNPHLGAQAALLTPGIAMIDEVDMFLHPAWQQTIIDSLRKAFPCIQFIVTTHSPQVLSTVKRESIRIIGPDVSGKVIAATPLAMTYGEPSGDVLHSVMMVDPQPPVREKADLQRLTEWVDQGHYASADARRLMQALIAALGEQHPQLQRLQRSIQRQEALKQ